MSPSFPINLRRPTGHNFLNFSEKELTRRLLRSCSRREQNIWMVLQFSYIKTNHDLYCNRTDEQFKNSPSRKDNIDKPTEQSQRIYGCDLIQESGILLRLPQAVMATAQVPLPENPPWWRVFDADKAGIDEVCRVLAQLYSLPKAQYKHVRKDDGSFTTRNSSQPPAVKETLTNGVASDTNASEDAPNQEAGTSKDLMVNASLDRLKESKKSDDEGQSNLAHEQTEIGSSSRRRSTSDRTESNDDWLRERERNKIKSRGRESDREGEREKEYERDKDKYKDKSHRFKDRLSGHSDRSRHHSLRDREDHYSSFSSRDKNRGKERHRHHHAHA